MNLSSPDHSLEKKALLQLQEVFQLLVPGSAASWLHRLRLQVVLVLPKASRQLVGWRPSAPNQQPASRLSAADTAAPPSSTQDVASTTRLGQFGRALDHSTVGLPAHAASAP